MKGLGTISCRIEMSHITVLQWWKDHRIRWLTWHKLCTDWIDLTDLSRKISCVVVTIFFRPFVAFSVALMLYTVFLRFAVTYHVQKLKPFQLYKVELKMVITRVITWRVISLDRLLTASLIAISKYSALHILAIITQVIATVYNQSCYKTQLKSLIGYYCRP